MVLVVKCGQIAPDMKVTGKAIKPMVKVNWFMLMVTSMKDSGSTIKLMERELILMLTALTTTVTGSTTSSTALGWSLGQMVLSTKEIT